MHARWGVAGAAALLRRRLEIATAFAVLVIAQAAAASGVLSGRVYEGERPDESRPLAGVTVALYGANNPYPASGTLLRSTVTDATGWYGLSVTDGVRCGHDENDAPFAVPPKPPTVTSLQPGGDTAL